MFKVEFSRANKIPGGYKKTICRIYYVDGNYSELVSEGVALWNNQADIYDLKIGKAEAYKKAFYDLPESAQQEFAEWIS